MTIDTSLLDRGIAFQQGLTGTRRQISAKERLALARALKHANPFYARLYRNTDCTDWAALPPIDKNRVTADYDALIAPSGWTRRRLEDFFRGGFALERTPDPGHLAFHSSGSSGAMSISLYSAFAFGRSIAAFHAMAVAGDEHDNPRLAYIGMTDRFNGGNQWIHFMAGLMPVALFSIFSDPEEIIGDLCDFAPTIMLTKPHSLIALAQAALRRGRQLRPRRLLSVGENLTARSREAILALYGTLPHNSFSTTETGPIGFQCDSSQEALDLYDNLNFVEILDEAGRPIEQAGREGVVTVSSLYNTAMPLIRYRLGDIACWIDDGDGTRRLSFIGKRGNRVLTFRNDGGCAGINESCLWNLSFPGVFDYRIVQTSPSALRIDIAAADPAAPPDPDTVIARLSETIAAAGCPLELHIAVRLLERIEPDARTAKIKRVVPLENDASSPLLTGSEK